MEADEVRLAVAEEAARLLYEGEHGEYLHAKEAAAARMAIHGLPSNAEVREALLRLADEREGAARVHRLEAMRRAALSLMEILTAFEPRLIGSVATGYAHRRSDLDLHLYTDDPPAVFQHLNRTGIVYQVRVVDNPQDDPELPEFVHLNFDFDEFPVEATLYPMHRLNRRPQCGLSGGPMLRLDLARVQALVGHEGHQQT